MVNHHKEDEFLDLSRRLEEIESEVDNLEREKERIEDMLEQIADGPRLNGAYIARCNELGV